MFTMEFLFMCLLAFGAYYVGIIIRKIALPGKDSPTLGKQLLLGLPVSLVVVTPLFVLVPWKMAPISESRGGVTVQLIVVFVQ